MSFEKSLATAGGSGRFQLLTFVILGFSCRLYSETSLVSNVFIAVEQDFACNKYNVTAPLCTEHQIGNYSTSRVECTPVKSGHLNAHIFTIQNHYGMVCELSYMVALCQTLYLVGFLAGSTFGGIAADITGRIRILSLLFPATAIIGTVIPFAPYWILYLIGRSIMGGLAGAIDVIAITYASEIIATKHRLSYLVSFFYWALSGHFYVSAAAYFLRNHQWLEVTLSAPLIIFTFVIHVLPESPRWLAAMNRREQAVASINTIARWNQNTLPQTELADLLNLDTSSQRSVNILHLFRNPGIRRITIILWLIAFGNGVSYYGLLLGSDQFTTNIYAYTAIGGAIEMVAVTIVICAGNKLGGLRLALLTGLAGSVLTIFCLLFVGDPTSIIGLSIFTMSARVCFDMYGFALNCYCAEIYPTPVRTTGTGSGLTIVGLGALVSPQVFLLSSVWLGIPFIVYFSLMLIATMCILFLPEMENIPSPETIDEGEVIYAQYILKKFLNNISLHRLNHEDHPGDSI